jgi:phosphomannomutase
VTLIKSISGIRGTIGGKPGEGLTPVDITKFAAAFGTWLIRNSGKKKVVIGRDARPSGKMVSRLVANTLVGLGIDVIDLGISTTPTVEMVVPKEEAGGGIILTASHNPVQWNALKLLNSNGEFISGKEGKHILGLVEKEDFDFASVESLGSYQRGENELNWHIDQIMDLELVDVNAIRSANFEIAVDAVNSSGGIAIPLLLEKLGVEVTELYCEPNGNFPHNPEPLPENITEACSLVRERGLDLGIIVDPDVDRLALVTEKGESFGEEYTLVAVADYILSKTPGNTVSNLSSTRALRDVTEKHGGEYFASAVGEVNVVEMMKERKAVIGGEGNGGVIYPDLHYGRDALVGIALFLSHLAISGMKASELRATYPDYHISKNKISLEPSMNVDEILEKVKEKYHESPINTIDGVKIELNQEWVHLRKSNTEPIIRIYAESSDKEGADYLAGRIMSDIKEIAGNS